MGVVFAETLVGAEGIRKGGGEARQDERGVRWMRGRTPMGRGGELRELAGPLLCLASDAPRFVTGQNLVVDEGWTIV